MCFPQFNPGEHNSSRTTENTVLRNWKTMKLGSRFESQLLAQFARVFNMALIFFVHTDSQLLGSPLASLHGWPACAHPGNDPGHAQSRVLHFQIHRP